MSLFRSLFPPSRARGRADRAAAQTEIRVDRPRGGAGSAVPAKGPSFTGYAVRSAPLGLDPRQRATPTVETTGDDPIDLAFILGLNASEARTMSDEAIMLQTMDDQRFEWLTEDVDPAHKAQPARTDSVDVSRQPILFEVSMAEDVFGAGAGEGAPGEAPVLQHVMPAGIDFSMVLPTVSDAARARAGDERAIPGDL